VRDDREARLREEMQEHIALQTADNRRAGMSPQEARRQALVKFGGVAAAEEGWRAERRLLVLESLVQDVRLALRVLGKSPAFTAAAVVTLSVAIGANAVVFGLMDALVLRPLNVPDAASLWGTQYGHDPGFQSYPNFRDLRERNHSFEDLAAFKFAFVGIDAGDESEFAGGFGVTGNYFDVLRVKPLLGRFFGPEDDHGPNSAPYLVLSHAYWHGRFHSDPNVIGRTVLLNRHPFTVVGVAPQGFRGTLLFISPDFFMPIVNQQQVDGESLLEERGSQKGIFEAFGHLKPGVTPEHALADLEAVGASLERDYPGEFGQKRVVLGRLGLTSFAGPVKAFVTALLLLAGVVLLAACADLGGLFAARTADRSREMALRLALGSSRTRIVQQLLTEAVLVSLLGGAVGLLGGVFLLRFLSAWQPFPRVPIHLPVSPDVRTYAVALLLSVLSGLLFGIAPVRQVLQADPYAVVKAGPGASSRRRRPLRDTLLVAQVALCALLVTSSLVAVRGLLRSLDADYGFEPRDVWVANTNLAMAGYEGEQWLPAQKRMIAALEAIPGVEGVGLVYGFPPLVNAASTRADVFKEDAAERTPKDVAASPYSYRVSPGYFRAAGTRLVAGRELSWHDDKDAPAVAVVNRTFANSVFGSVTASLGRAFRQSDGKRVEVVGVAADGRYLGLGEEPQPAIFLSFLQAPQSQSCLLVRSAQGSQPLAAAIRNRLSDLDDGLPADVDTWDNLLQVVMFPASMAVLSLGVLGLIGAVLSLTGVFGMAAYSVSRRLRELSIRLALGARRTDVLRSALGRALQLLALGSAAGLLLGILASRVLASIVYQATPRDPLVLAGVVACMLLLGLLATWIPARRVLALDPAVLLREQ